MPPKPEQRSAKAKVERKLVTKPDTSDAIKKGAAKRRRAGLDTDGPTSLGKELAHIAGKHGVLIEWTVKPIGPGEVAACACVCSYVCSCYAMPQSHSEVVIDPAVIGRQVLERDSLDLGGLFER